MQDAKDKDTIRVEIDISGSGLEYLPGDALGIHASNAPEVGVISMGMTSQGWKPAFLSSIPLACS